MLHRHAAPVRLVDGAPQRFDGKQFVPVGEDVRLDRDGLADHSLGCKAAAIDRGGNIVDHDPVRGAISAARC